jgi:hypothetical protein
MHRVEFMSADRLAEVVLEGGRVANQLFLNVYT